MADENEDCVKDEEKGLRTFRVVALSIYAAVLTLILGFVAWNKMRESFVARSMDMSANIAVKRLERLGYPLFGDDFRGSETSQGEQIDLWFKRNGGERHLTMFRSGTMPTVCDVLLETNERLETLIFAARAIRGCQIYGDVDCEIPVGAGLMPVNGKMDLPRVNKKTTEAAVWLPSMSEEYEYVATAFNELRSSTGVTTCLTNQGDFSHVPDCDIPTDLEIFLHGKSYYDWWSGCNDREKR